MTSIAMPLIEDLAANNNDKYGMLPLKFTWFEGQIAGHNPTMVKDGKRQLGMVKESGNGDKILKPAQDGKRGEREVQFYHDVFVSGMNDPSLNDLRRLLPNFFGTRKIEIEAQESLFLVLEDVTCTFSLPASIDIKIGKQTFGPDATEAKKLKEIETNPVQGTLGYRVLGYRIAEQEDNTFKKDPKWRSEENRMISAVQEFFDQAHDVHIIKEQLLEKLGHIKKVAGKRRFHMYSSSILIVYENDRNCEQNVDVRMIDFSHVHPGMGLPDDNYLFGLNRLIETIEEL
ncbi:unnamed protein product [Caenorhabditis auriculariae]|uniref:Kinase n=1 Tax=Caenorhabditis auriculariae TaxID=2777116 RepID=A0A8S1GZD6_9PELO|nr:unnamed protein product [Caenorhabditis auriculariae]